MPLSNLRHFESHAGSVPILVYLYNEPTGHAYRKQIEYEVHIQTATATRTIAFLIRLGLLKEDVGLDDRRRALRFYSLTENGRRVGRILDDAERALEHETVSGYLNLRKDR